MGAKIIQSQVVTITGASARTAQLGIGLRYAVKATQACTIRQGGSGVVAAADTAGNWPLAAMETIELSVSEANNAFIAVIGASGTLFVAIQEGS